MTDQQAEKSIITHCIEHAKTQQSTCADCGKTIPHKSLRVAEIYRKNKKVKKDLAKHTWYHFKCWKVPEYLTHVPIEQFRGYPTLNEKDKARVQKVIKQGTGASWKQLMETSKPVKTEEELEAEREEQKKKDEKKKEDQETQDMDMTQVLTGTQQKSKSKKKNELKPKTDKKNKADKKKVTKKETPKAKEISLPKEDLAELQNFAKEFNAMKQ
ncbi:uncharacterized protein B0P05DRAFT_539388 [Gilbertella persicaria]|uniref:uncharacterized protein n=1 Tax=Gilbertella persicaria TaxID=101096 RepID=UPI0022210AFE|nr:uncharacterized protein B0P05DRAFT_539388 [Gilbertella persicaria]KAI8080736.1 hypothetical protein B0P05DRAFT_539388 [Gilbertella persicaria]